MRVSRAVAKFNRRVTNPLLRATSGWMPGFGILDHVGRKSGRTYHTPVVLFESATNFVICIGYGTETDWVKNVEHAGSAAIQRHGRIVRAANPTVVSKDAGAGYLTSGLTKLRYRIFPYNEAALVLTKVHG